MPDGRNKSLTRMKIPERFFLAKQKASKPAPSAISDSLFDSAFIVSRKRPKDRKHNDLAKLPQMGSVVDRYRIGPVVGSGAFGVVFSATHLVLKSPVALKFLRPSVLLRHPKLGSLFCSEAALAARIDHPNVVRVYDGNYAGDLAYVVMEYIQGESLYGKLKQQRLSPLETLDVGIGAARGLEAAWKQGIIHRDVKPANIIIDPEGLVKIVDLGLAHSLESLDANGSRRGRRFTARRTGLVGTPGYASPEQVRNPETLDFRADIYSLGATLYHAAVGRAPYPTELNAFLKAQKEGMMFDLKKRLDDVPSTVSTMILSMLSPHPDDRPKSYKLLIDQLSDARHKLLPEDAVQDPPPHQHKDKSSTPRYSQNS